ncbi:hypothetical protein [Bradyrhizobium sp.]|uniref:hypothetical protein n=1 Tax=Bradyrhizobium sp. TaxID=376 RepID=UPI00238D4B34|nr:hypothetical protein [Bradyrhizobium sp.]MDE2377917.1 hypothetical protein [Bradyrhizobium sp.]
MSDLASTERAQPTRTTVWIGVAAVLLLVLGANAHLVYVAVRSQPSCVVHVRQGEIAKGAGSFSAAQSACSLSERVPSGR